MRNFARVVKLSWRYRWKLIFSAVFAAFVAMSWSLNISAIFPVLKILGSNSNLHTWADNEINKIDGEIQKDGLEENLKKIGSEINETQGRPESPERDERLRKLTSKQSEYHGKFTELTRKKYYYQLLDTKVLCYIPADRFKSFCWIIGLVILSVAVKGIFEFFQESLVGTVVCKTLLDLRNQLFRATIHQDTHQLAEIGTPELLSRFTNDTEQIGTGLKMLYGRVVLEPFKIIGCVGAAMLISWQLTLMFAIIVPVALLTLTFVGKQMKRASKRVLERMSDIYRILRESIDGIRVVKAFTRESHERNRFHQATYDHFRKSMRVINLDAFSGPLMELLGIAAVGLALLAGSYLVIEGKTELFGFRMLSQPMSFEALCALYMLLAAVADPVRKLASVFSKIQSGAVAADRIYAVFDRVPTVANNSNGPAIPKHSKQIEFKHICFSYIPGKDTLLDLDLTVKFGETVAIVGPNGSGKSTLIGLIARFYDPNFGTVSIDGISLRDANLRSLRKQLGIVTQDTVLFEDTIHNNIAYGKPGASREDVTLAAQQAFAHEFIENMPEGYDSKIGDRGNNLSGGQKQRIALARAILRNPRILILDEFTSAVDTESEQKIHTALKQFVEGRTTFLITHRLTTLDIADRIVVMDAGRIVATGRHEQLIQNCDVYRRLYESQSSSRNSDEMMRTAA
jgi:ATP-binding cassette, subfamily B, bacterial MsbA